MNHPSNQSMSQPTTGFNHTAGASETGWYRTERAHAARLRANSRRVTRRANGSLQVSRFLAVRYGGTWCKSITLKSLRCSQPGTTSQGEPSAPRVPSGAFLFGTPLARLLGIPALRCQRSGVLHHALNHSQALRLGLPVQAGAPSSRPLHTPSAFISHAFNAAGRYRRRCHDRMRWWTR
jgi:hypothetical protein